MLKIARAALAVALLVAACACSNEKFSDPLVFETPATGQVKRVQPVHLEMTLAGAEQFTLKTDTHLVFVEIASDVPVSLWFVSISAPTDPPLSISDGRQILFTADLAPGIYRGSGKTYALGAQTQGSVLGVPSNLKSAAYITVTKLQPLQLHTFDLGNASFAVPCSLVVGDRLHTGSVTCPKLTDAAGKTVSLQWTWRWI